MSAIAAITVPKSINGNHAITGITFSGTLNTDYQNVTLSPVGIDKNGVAKYRHTAAASIALAETLSFSTGLSTNGGSAVSRLVLQVPYEVTVNGVTQVKKVTAEFKLSSDVAMTNTQRRAAINACFNAISQMANDMIQVSSPY